MDDGGTGHVAFALDDLAEKGRSCRGERDRRYDREEQQRPDRPDGHSGDPHEEDHAGTGDVTDDDRLFSGEDVGEPGEQGACDDRGQEGHCQGDAGRKGRVGGLVDEYARGDVQQVGADDRQHVGEPQEAEFSNPQDMTVAALPCALCCGGLVALVTGFFVEARIVHPALPHLFTGGEITLGCDFMTNSSAGRAGVQAVSVNSCLFRCCQ